MRDEASHWAALAALAVVSAAWLAVIVGVLSVVGGLLVFAALVAGALALAWLLRDLRGDYAVLLGVAVLLVGFAVYLLVVPPAVRDSLSVSSTVTDTLALLTGYSVYRLVEAGAWALAVTPGPLFLAWYFGFRRSYAPAGLVAGGTLGFFVLTGDAGSVATLAGTVGALLTVALGRLAAHGGGGRRQAQLVAAGVALCVLTPALVTAVPGGGASPLVTPPTPQAELTAPGDHVAVGGRLRLSPKVTFVATAEKPAYYRVASYDRFTGNSWLQSGAPTASGSLTGPPGPDTPLKQTITLRQPIDALPAAAEPVNAHGISYTATRFGNLRPTGNVHTPATYTVYSQRVNATAAQLRRAGTDYPTDVSNAYLQLPSSTDPAVSRVAANVTANASTPYAKARAISSWLAANRAYSLDAPNPNGNLANYFVLNANATGYCTYYASAMVVMLRSQGVPARFVVGYTPGQQVDANQWVVRGYDSHAWVEVYFPDYGWVRFDPTPSGARQTAERHILKRARANGTSGVDTAGSDRVTTTTATTSGNGSNATSTSNATASTPVPGDSRLGRRLGATGRNGTANGTNASNAGSSNAGGGGPSIPPAGTVALWVVLVAGVVGALQYAGIPGRVLRAVWLRRPPTGTPAEMTAAAFDRVEYVLARTRRPRRDGETVRAYLDAVDAPQTVRDVALARERARYADGIDAAAAQDARRHANRFVAGYARFVPNWDR